MADYLALGGAMTTGLEKGLAIESGTYDLTTTFVERLGIANSQLYGTGGTALANGALSITGGIGAAASALSADPSRLK